MRKCISILMVLVLLCSLSAVYASAKSATSESLLDTGSWEINQGSTSLKKNPEAKEAYLSAKKHNLTLYTYQHMAYLGCQTVAGTNYCYLVRKTSKIDKDNVTYALLYVYEPLTGPAVITKTHDILLGEDISKTQGLLEKLQSSSGEMVGGWEVNTGAFTLKKHKAAKKALDTAVHPILGVSYKGIGLLGSQVVAGTNYCVLARRSGVGPYAKNSRFVLVYVYADLSGNAEVTEIQNVDIAEYA